MIEADRFGSNMSALLAIGVGRPVANELGTVENQAGRTSRFDRLAVIADVVL